MSNNWQTTPKGLALGLSLWLWTSEEQICVCSLLWGRGITLSLNDWSWAQVSVSVFQVLLEKLPALLTDLFSTEAVWAQNEHTLTFCCHSNLVVNVSLMLFGGVAGIRNWGDRGKPKICSISSRGRRKCSVGHLSPPGVLTGWVWHQTAEGDL